MKRNLFVDLKENSYNILIEKGLLSKLGEELKKIYFGEKIFIITDENVDKYYGDKVKGELDKAGYKTRKMVLAQEKRPSPLVHYQVYIMNF